MPISSDLFMQLFSRNHLNYSLFIYNYIIVAVDKKHSIDFFNKLTYHRNLAVK